MGLKHQERQTGVSQGGTQVRVVHIYRTYFPDQPGGLQEAIRQICFNSMAYGIQNTVFTLSQRPEPAELCLPEARVVRCRSWAAPSSCDLGDWRAVSRFSRLAARADVLNYHYPWPFADVMNLLIRPSVPAVLTYHSDIIRQRFVAALYSPLLWWILRKMRTVVATSPVYAKTSPILSHPSVRAKVIVIPLGIDDHSYLKNADDKVFERIGVVKGEPYFLFIGVLRYYKGLDSLIQAAPRLQAKVIIAGFGPEGNRLKSLAVQLGARNVVFAGQVTDSEKAALLRDCKALVLPSHLRSEAFGMTLVEAAMFGKPLISCEIGSGTSFVNQNNETGFVVLSESPSKLAEAMNVLLYDDVLTKKMGIAARKRYELVFSGKALGKAYAALYQTMAKAGY